jgi:hypothetical protein
MELQIHSPKPRATMRYLLAVAHDLKPDAQLEDVFGDPVGWQETGVPLSLKVVPTSESSTGSAAFLKILVTDTKVTLSGDPDLVDKVAHDPVWGPDYTYEERISG